MNASDRAPLHSIQLDKHQQVSTLRHFLCAGSAEDDGWILSVCYDASKHSSECVILDARKLHLVARLPLCHTLPHGLHGSWHHVSHSPAGGLPEEAVAS